MGKILVTSRGEEAKATTRLIRSPGATARYSKKEDTLELDQLNDEMIPK
jgi:hypothetical protein